MRPFGKLVTSPFSMQVSNELYAFGLNAALFVFCTKHNTILQSRMPAPDLLITPAIQMNVLVVSPNNLSDPSSKNISNNSLNHSLNHLSDSQSSHPSRPSLNRNDCPNSDADSNASYASWPSLENIIRENAMREAYAKLFADQKTNSNGKEVYSFVYISFAESRQKLLVFAGFLIAHLGVFAFLFQVFDDRGGIMQVCCYSQLGLLLLCFVFYILTYILDALTFYNAKRIIDRVFKPNDNIIIYLCSTDRCERISQIFSQQNVLADSNDFLHSIYSGILDCLFAASLTALENLTIAYIYNNVSK